MSRNNIQAYYHIVFATKYREPSLIESIQPALYKMIWKKCEEIGCAPIIINGVEDHIHLLLQPNPQTSISKILKDIKGSSSKWLNDNFEFEDFFSWQRGYGLFTVSPKDVKTIATYIKNQKEHHKANSIINEFEI